MERTALDLSEAIAYFLEVLFFFPFFSPPVFLVITIHLFLLVFQRRRSIIPCLLTVKRVIDDLYHLFLCDNGAPFSSPFSSFLNEVFGA